MNSPSAARSQEAGFTQPWAHLLAHLFANPGGDKHKFGDLFYQPTILTGVKKGMDCFEEEIFGPVVSVLKFDKEEEAIAIANDCNMGLAAYFFSRDVNQVHATKL